MMFSPILRHNIITRFGNSSYANTYKYITDVCIGGGIYIK